MIFESTVRNVSQINLKAAIEMFGVLITLRGSATADTTAHDVLHCTSRILS
jgi:hypothetical protein